MNEYEINPGYAHAQIAKALAAADEHPDAATRERAREKVARWRQVLAGLADGSIAIGSRTPLKAPAWATPEVVTGGFATGNLMAGGALLEHERALALALSAPDDGARTALNRHYLTDAGLADLATRVRERRYDIDVPEEGALPAVAWLVEHGHVDAARDIVTQIAPYFDTLRFYPKPRDTPRNTEARLFVQSARTTAQALHDVAPNAKILAQREAVEVWAPFHDRVVALMLDVVDDALPQRRFDAAWVAQAQALLAEFTALRREHHLTGRVGNPKSHVAQLRNLLARCADAPATLTDGNIRQVRFILDGYVNKHGRPASPQRTALRERQRAEVAAPLYSQFAVVAARRVEACAPDEGIDDVDALTVPVADGEATASGIAAGSALPLSVRRKIERARTGTVQTLVACGLITSSESLALVLPQLTSNVRAQGIADATLRDLYATVYRAFRRRRSLLLLDLAKQVQIAELPWIAAIDTRGSHTSDAASTARQTLVEAATLTLATFPSSILPNRLLREFDALAKAAQVDLPLTEEVAADIFMGRFSPKFAAAARIAADLLDGTLYASYYGIDWHAVRNAAERMPRTKSGEADAFGSLCASRAGVPPGRHWPATNGMIIEQQQILTTHNLAALFTRLDLTTILDDRLDAMAFECFRHLCERLQLHMPDKHAQLTTIKNCAYAGRQMLFFASMLPAERCAAVLRAVHAHAAAQPEPFRTRFAPVLKGLARVVRGESLDDADAQASGARRFLGWSDEGHWLLVRTKSN
jgi:hypothetical protein